MNIDYLCTSLNIKIHKVKDIYIVLSTDDRLLDDNHNQGYSDEGEAIQGYLKNHIDLRKFSEIDMFFEHSKNAFKRDIAIMLFRTELTLEGLQEAIDKAKVNLPCSLVDFFCFLKFDTVA